MRIPLSWLQEFVQVDLSAEEIGEVLTSLGLEVDSVEPLPLPFQGVIIGEVIEAVPHPEAERLQVATVNDGVEQHQVVCGAPNCRKGLKSAFAPVGAVLHTGEKPFKIKRAKLRGVESQGMLCSGAELGLGDDHEGIIELEGEAGTPLEALYGDTIFEISLTPNLGHCFSVLGVARELAAKTGAEVRMPSCRVESAGKGVLPIELEAPELCPLYSYRLIRGVKVAPSSPEVQKRLEACGLRPRNNVVDVTNLVMQELGQPLHAFDAAKLEEKVLVRASKEGEKLTTLDGVERSLPSDVPVICDGRGIVAIGGVMGGANSEVGEETVDVLLESAHFAPAAVRRASSRLDLKSDASRRFERGCDPAGVERALDRAASLIGGAVSERVVAGSLPAPRRAQVRIDRVNQLLGSELSLGEVKGILERLEFQPKEMDGTLDVGIPSYRFDVTSEIDLVEEVARLHGYDRLQGEALRFSVGDLRDAPEYLFEQQTKKRCVGLGLQELMTVNLISPEQAGPFGGGVPLTNPSSEELSILRPSLLPGLLQVTKYNRDRGVDSLAGFEVGRVHSRSADHLVERPKLGIILYGKRPPHFDEPEKDLDFLDLKGIVEVLVPGATFEKSSLEFLHPGRQASIGELGWLGELHPSQLSGALYAEIDLFLLSRVAEERRVVAPSPYPGSDRDWTLTVREEVPVQTILDAACAKLLQKVSLTAIYRSDTIGEGWKNVTFRFRYRDDRKTIAAQTVEKEHARVVKMVSDQLGEQMQH
jgi:phenylalanyl-tRNA synthetase beta chain